MISTIMCNAGKNQEPAFDCASMVLKPRLSHIGKWQSVDTNVTTVTKLTEIRDAERYYSQNILF